jgi:hypothetical protein
MIIAGQVPYRLLGVKVEARDAPRAADHMDQLLPVRQVRAQDEVVRASRRQLEHAGIPTDGDRAPVRAAGDVLDAWDRARREIGDHRVPVERATERQPKQQAPVGDQPVRLAALLAQHPRRRPEDVAARPVELAQAAEAGGEGDLGDRQIGIVEEATSEVGARRARQSVWRHPQVSGEQPAQVAGRHTEPIPQLGLGSVIQCAVQDQPDRATDQLGARPRNRRRFTVRAASEAGAVAGRLGRRGQIESPHVALAGLRGASRPAVDPGGDDRREGFHDHRYSGSR